MSEPRGLTEAENTLVRAAVRRISRRAGSYRKAAEQIGLSPAGIVAFLTGKSGTSAEIAERVATVLGTTRAELARLVPAPTEVLACCEPGLQECEELIAEARLSKAEQSFQRLVRVLEDNGLSLQEYVTTHGDSIPAEPGLLPRLLVLWSRLLRIASQLYRAPVPQPEPLDVTALLLST